MRTRLLFLCILVLRAPWAVSGPEILDLRERIVLNEDGSADLTMSVRAALATGEELVLPFAHAVPDSISADGDSIRTALRETSGLRFLVLTAPWTEGKPVGVRMHIPAFIGWSSLKRAEYDNVTLRHAFTNTTPQLVQHYRGDMFLPKGYSVTSILASKPEQTEKDPVAPFEILEEDGRAGVSIRSALLGLGDGAFISFRCKPADKSPVLLIALALAGLLYLVFFRDVLKENGNGPTTAQNAQS